MPGRWRAGRAVRSAWEGTRPLLEGARAVARFLPTVDRARARAMAAAAVALGALPVAAGVLAAVLVARLLERAAAGETVLGGAGMVVLLVAVPALLLAREAVVQLALTWSASMGRKVDDRLRQVALDAALAPAGIVHLEDPEMGAAFAQARNLAPLVFTPGEAARQLVFSAAPRVEAVLAAAVVAVVEPLLAVALVALWAAAQVAVVSGVLGSVATTALSMYPPDVVYLRDLVLTPPAAKELRVFGIGGWVSGRFLDAAAEKVHTAWALRKGTGRSYLLAGAAYGVAYGTGLWWVGRQAAAGDAGLTSAAVVVLCMLRMFQVPNLVADVPVAYGSFAIPAVHRAQEIAASGAGRLPGERHLPGPPSHAIELRGVSFTYPRGAAPVLDGLDLRIPAGQRLALVGLSGAGKTTLIKLLCRLYDPDEGAVVVDGTDLRDVEPASWRRHLSVLFQEFVRYELSVADNVALDGTGPADVERAVAAAGAADLVARLPAGVATPLSPARTGGVDLSGGQWQRVALARALAALERGARVLVLDEPSASLDARSEMELFDTVLDAVARAPADGAPVTTLLISHRFATVRRADRIVVLDGGRVVEDGTHEELLALGGRYAELFEAQASRFRLEGML